MKETFTFNDILIEPAYSDIESRTEIDITSDFLGARRIPIISAPMDTVSGPRLVAEMSKANAYGILHRFQMTPDYTLRDILKTRVLTDKSFGISIGAKHPKEVFKLLAQLSEIPHSITIDVAHGYHKLVKDMIEFVRHFYLIDPPLIIAGNVATAEGFAFLARAGANAIRVGIGGGSACTTRETTGVGVPQLSAIIDCVAVQGDYGWGPVSLIADGGIQTPGDSVKALAAGADAVMLGKMLAGAEEAPGNTAKNITTGKGWKEYRGQSTVGTNGERKAPEGVSASIPITGPVKDTIESLSQYIKSGFSYCGARNLTELRNKANFVRTSFATLQESNTRI